MTQILNTWCSRPNKLVYYTVIKEVYRSGDFAVYKNTPESYLYTYKNIAITCLVGLNKALVDSLANNATPPEGCKNLFLHDRSLRAIEFGNKLLLGEQTNKQNENQNRK